MPLSDDSWAYARVLKEPLVEFYDGVATSEEKVVPEALLGMKVIFRIDVMNSAIASGRWKIVGRADLTEKEEWHAEKFFKEDALSGKISIYWEDPRTGQINETPASLEDCRSLERAAVWSPERVEDRLRDHHAGVPNKWVESLRPRRQA